MVFSSDHQHVFFFRSSACFFLQIISLFFSSDPQRGWDNLLQLPLLRILPPLPPRQMPEAKRKCLKYFTFFYFCLFLCEICENCFAPSTHSRPSRQMPEGKCEYWRYFNFDPFFITFVILVEHFFVKCYCSFFWKYLSKIKEFEILQFYLCFFSVNLSPDSTTLA